MFLKSIDQAIDEVWERKASFFLMFFIVFSLSYLFLLAIDFVPEKPQEQMAEEASSATADEEVPSSAEPSLDPENTDTEVETIVGSGDNSISIYPESLIIEQLGRRVSVLNPQSRLVTDLDNALLEGVVRHPDSVTLGKPGTVFILGHSSYLPTVFNKNFQALNGIQNLAWGDTIKLVSGDVTYEYQVDKVYQARAQEVTVPIDGEESRLVLATCNSFGSVDDRYIVEAKQVAVRQL